MNKLLENFRNNKQLAIILIIGLVMLVVPSVMTKGEKKEETRTDYEAALQVRLENVLSQIKGAGQVRVMITLSDEGTVIPAVDKTVSATSSQEKNVVISGDIAELYRTKPRIQGVVVVAEGGESPTVKEALSGAVSALCDVSAHNIKVYSLK